MKKKPLNVNETSEWTSYFKDNEILVQIDKDVRRLCPDFCFFQKPTDFPCTEIKNAANAERYQSLRKRVAYTQLRADEVSKNRLGITKFKTDAKKSATIEDEQSEYAHLPDGQEAHWEIVERILFIFAKLNPGQSYVQGMNEICGPIYYTFATDPDIEWRSELIFIFVLLDRSTYIYIFFSRYICNRACRGRLLLLFHQFDGHSGHTRQLLAIPGQLRVRHQLQHETPVRSYKSDRSERLSNTGQAELEARVLRVQMAHALVVAGVQVARRHRSLGRVVHSGRVARLSHVHLLWHDCVSISFFFLSSYYII